MTTTRRPIPDDPPEDSPILFTGPMMRALLACTKVETRRLPSPLARRGLDLDTEAGRAECLARCPYGPLGQRLWVRERHALTTSLRADGHATVHYAADGLVRGVVDPRCDRQARGLVPSRSRPSIHLPRWACRLELETVGLSLERLHELDAEGARCEGIPLLHSDAIALGLIALSSVEGIAASEDLWNVSTRVENFTRVWDAINGDRGAPWGDNPWVYRVRVRVAARLVDNAMREVPRG